MLLVYLVLLIGWWLIPSSKGGVVIDNSTDSAQLRSFFHCSFVQHIGAYNEYFRTCQFKMPPKETNDFVHFRHIHLPFESVLNQLPSHVEIVLSNLTEIHLENSTLSASAFTFHHLQRLTIDEHSHVNVSAKGLKFGPGFESKRGASFGGTGGSHSASCDNGVDRPLQIGDLKTASWGDFRGYGSGGGEEGCRGAGRINVSMVLNFTLHGNLLANGGHSPPPSFLRFSSSAGSGGMVYIQAGLLSGKGAIEACGGNGEKRTTESEGGGGGGGGRIYLMYNNTVEFDVSNTIAFGGGVQKENKDTLLACQYGGDGTILIIEQPLDIHHQEMQFNGKLIVKGNGKSIDRAHETIRKHGSTPLFYFNDRHYSSHSNRLFIPDYVVQIVVMNGATVSTNCILLELNLGKSLSQLVINPNSYVQNLEGNSSIELRAGEIIVQGSIEIFQSENGDDDDMAIINLVLNSNQFHLVGGGVLSTLGSLEVSARQFVKVDKTSIIYFAHSIDIRCSDVVEINGFLIPTTKKRIYNPIQVTSLGNAHLDLQPVGGSPLLLKVISGGNIEVLLAVTSPFFALSLSGVNIYISGKKNDDDVQVGRNNENDCTKAFLPNDMKLVCNIPPVSELVSGEVRVFANNMTRLSNVKQVSLLVVCSRHFIEVKGLVSAKGMGCSNGLGPGHSQLEYAGKTSGGAGHGGRGGNVLPANAGGGPMYLNVTWPGSASTSTTVAAALSSDSGSGGGVIFLSTDILQMNAGTELSVAGNDGKLEGQGGGSGGSIILIIQLKLVTMSKSLINLKGGLGRKRKGLNMQHSSMIYDDTLSNLIGNGGGGGGGGGILSTSFGFHGNGEAFVKNGGAIQLTGGVSEGGSEPGTIGVTLATNCSAGRGGVMCLKCARGSYNHNSIPKLSCVLCPYGSFADKDGATACTKCLPGSFANQLGSSSCSNCAAGSFCNKLGCRTCSKCPAGFYASSTGQTSCAKCPKGSISPITGGHICDTCGIGKESSWSRTKCLACSITRKPVHSIFNTKGSCSYKCDKGRIGVACLTPFERFVEPLGGVVGFFAIVVVGVFLLLSCCFFSNKKIMKKKKQQRKNSRDSLYTTLNSNRLNEKDMKSHLTRLYFDGQNTFDSSWALNAEPPSSIDSNNSHEFESMIYAGSFALFATKVSQLLYHKQGSDHLSYWDYFGKLIGMWCPFMYFFWERQCQLKKIFTVNKYITQYGLGFFQDVHLRTHQGKLKLGFSPDLTLGYIDVLIDEHAFHYQKENSNLVVVLSVSGFGTFLHPFAIDTNDVLVRSVPNRFALLSDYNWIEFIAHFNQLIRLLPSPSKYCDRLFLTNIIDQILSLVQKFNTRHESMNIHIAFGTFSSFRLGNSFKKWDVLLDPRLFTHFRENKTVCFKFAVQISRSSPNFCVVADNSSSNSSICTMLEIDEEKGTLDNFLRNSSIRQDALFGGNEQKLLEKLADRKMNEDLEKTLDPSSPLGASAQFPLGEASMEENRGSQLKRFIDIILSFVWMGSHSSSFFLPPNVPVKSELRYQWLIPFILLTFLVADLLVTFFLLMNIFCVQVQDPTAYSSGCSHVAFFVILIVRPGSLLLAPFVGISFVLKGDSFLGRMFGLWNGSCYVSLIACVICCAIYSAYLNVGTIMLYTILLFGLKILETRHLYLCLGQFEKCRKHRGWRGLYTTHDYYDSISNPILLESEDP